MVSVIMIGVAVFGGLAAYLVLAAAGGILPPFVRAPIAGHFWKQTLRSYNQLAIVRREIGQYDLLPMRINDEQDVVEVSLSSGLIGDDQTLKFEDPSNSIKRLYKKPVAVVYDRVPAAVSPTLAEVGEAAGDHRHIEGDGATARINPWVRISDSLRAVDPASIRHLLLKNSESEDIETVERLTKQRFAKYGESSKLMVSMGTLMGFVTGAGGYVAIVYVRDEVIGSGGGTPSGGPLPLLIDVLGVIL